MVDDSLEWMARSRRRGALRLIIVGVVLAIGGCVWLVESLDFKPNETITVRDANGTHTRLSAVRQHIDPRIVSSAFATIGVLISIAGIVMFVRVRRPD
jgi:hypothetical protein